MDRIRCLLIKELAQLRRDRRLFGILIIAPLIQLMVLSFAANTDVREIAMAIRDQDNTRDSRELVSALGASGYFKISYAPGSASGDARLLVSGQAGLIVVIPKGFSKELQRGRVVSLQALVDGADSNFGVQGLNYLQKAVRLFNERLVRVHRDRLVGARPPALPAVAAESRVWYNPDLKSRYYMVPAIMAQLLMVVTMLVSSAALVKEREEGTFEQLIVTPLRPFELLAGKLLPFVVVGFVEMTLALPVILFVLDVPFRGHLGLLYAISGIFLISTLGLGLFISTIVRNQQQAMIISTFFVMLPFILLSGFAFPVENMPNRIQKVAEFIPMKHYLVMVRAIFLKDARWPELWPHAARLLALGLGILSLAILNFRKRLD